MNKNEVIQKILEIGIVPSVRVDSPSRRSSLQRLCIKPGFQSSKSL